MGQISGTQGNDVIQGTWVDDIIWALRGNDIVFGRDGDDHIYGYDGDDFIEGGAGADLVSGGNGSDWASYAGSSTGVTVRLDTGKGYTGDAAGDTLYLIENLSGSASHDLLYGDAGANIIEGNSGNDYIHGGAGNDDLRGGRGNDLLVGGAGADKLWGGDGIDTANYYDASGFVYAWLWNGYTYGGDAQGDSFRSIENLTGSRFGDFLWGDAQANRIDGREGDDRLYGDACTDTLIGGEGKDYLEGGAGADWLFGDSGSDTASYLLSAEGVRVDLAAGTGRGGDAEGDHYRSIENLTGSNHEDSLYGTAGANNLFGYEGADVLFGHGGNDWLSGMDGDDFLNGGAGADVLDGGWSGNDWASYAGSGAGVRVFLSSGRGFGGDAEGDTLRDIENLSGSDHADVLRGNDGANVLEGGRGNDRLTGAAGGDTLRGGLGADRFDFNAERESSTSAPDRIADFSQLQDDLIDLWSIDANRGLSGNQAFTFIGEVGSFTAAGQVRYVNTNDKTIIFANTDSDGYAEMQIELDGVHDLTVSDFVL